MKFILTATFCSALFVTSCQTGKKAGEGTSDKPIDESNPAGESTIRNDEPLKAEEKPAVDAPAGKAPGKVTTKRKKPVKK